jgi:hypothetical protein
MDGEPGAWTEVVRKKPRVISLHRNPAPPVSAPAAPAPAFSFEHGVLRFEVAGVPFAGKLLEYPTRPRGGTARGARAPLGSPARLHELPHGRAPPRSTVVAAALPAVAVARDPARLVAMREAAVHHVLAVLIAEGVLIIE